MMDSRRCPSARPGASNTPSSSGPRWAMQRSISLTADVSMGSLRSSAAIPAMPHISESSRQPAKTAPAVGIVMFDLYVGQTSACKPLREFVAADVIGNRRHQVIEDDGTLLAIGERRDVGEVRSIGQAASVHRSVHQLGCEVER